MTEPNKMKVFGIVPADPEEAIPVKQATAANLKVEATIAAAQTVVVIQPTAANLKVQAAIAAAQTIAVTQATPANLKAQVEIAANQEIGIYPKLPSGVTQRAVSADVEDALVVLFTVPAGKVFYLLGGTLSVLNSSAALGHGYIDITNASDTRQYRPFRLHVDPDHALTTAHSFIVPLEIAAGFKIRIFSSQATLYASGFIHGWND